MFNRVLVPLDGTEVSEGIIPFVRWLASGMKMGVVLARAVDIHHTRDESFDSALGRILSKLGDGGTKFPFDSTADFEPWELELVARIERELKAPLDSIANKLSQAGISTETIAAYGSASETIIRVAQETGCNLIAMSTRGRSVLTSGLLGSVTYRVIHESPIPILSITPERARLHAEDNVDISNLVVPLDGSEFGETVLSHAATLARQMSLRVSLLRVTQEQSALFDDNNIALDEILSGVEPKTTKKVHDYMEGVAARLRNSGIEVNEVLLGGKVSTEIVNYAQGLEHSMIALATHGRSGVSRLLLGSIAEAVIRESGCPVLVIRPAPLAQEQVTYPQPAT
ncbi:MAG: universal stress protein [Chloroflexi bacterium]|nr:universal stress protein [Chloroflexota bacterium]